MEQMIVSLDTETTGLDPWHGTMPYLVTVATDSGDQVVWEWDVDPFTRRPSPDLQDLEEIQELINGADRIVLQNATFDLKMLETLNGPDWRWEPWPWDKIDDTQISAHMLASCRPRDLTNLALIYLNVNLQPYEDEIHRATEKARRVVRSKIFREEMGDWALAKAGRPDMPSAAGECWKADMWLPRTLCQLAPDYLPDWEGWKAVTPKEVGDDPAEHPWWDLVHSYANSDSDATLHVFLEHERRLSERGQWPIYEERRKLLRLVYDMKETGVTVNARRKEVIYREYAEEAELLREKCVKIANNPDLTDLPVNGRSNALNTVVFDQFGLTSPFRTSKGNPSMSKEAIGYWLEELEPTDSRRLFLSSLLDYRKRKTAMAYMDGYERFWLPVGEGDVYVLHPSLHATGTNTLRWSSSNPNEQNISKKEGFNLRYCFGPAEGRLWASLDYENIELRIPAYESGEAELIELFDRPDEPPFYGSVHMLNFSTVFPDKWKEAVGEAGLDRASDWVKSNWKASWYQRCKNGDFAVQYGSVERGGNRWSTADRAFGRKGCQALLKERFSRQEDLNQYWIDTANRTGYVSTMPDLEVCPEQGYPIQCARSAWGDISPTVPLNYHVQGTACWVIFRAMLKVQDYLDRVNQGVDDHLKIHQVMQVHDELVIDLPNVRGYQVHLRNIQAAMESCGECIGVPLKVGVEIHDNNWAEGRGL